MTAREILQKFENQNILIVGDVMLDRYLTGTVSRISPEAPVPVVLHRATEDRLGGAANVALNIRALGATPVLCTVVGQDAEGQALRRMLPENGMTDSGLVLSETRRTTVKTRVLGNNQQMLRIDQEDDHDLSKAEENILLERVVSLLNNTSVQAIILQDYNKGVLTPAVIDAVLSAARQRGILTAVDPKKHNFFAFRGADLFKPNLKEIRDSVPFQVQADLDSLQQAANFLHKKLEHSITMITLSEKGLFLENQKEARLYPTVPRNVADVSGAGDTVISVAALGLAAGLTLPVVAALSNLAGGQVCEYPGVVPVQRDILEAELDHWLLENKYA
ncbi:MAG: bifunctional ADP-heptose synthase [Thermoanaerobaculia bacterium]|nr:bifunctional ADP-heptose synthase [Thermoanaerobaculia bacterium]